MSAPISMHRPVFSRGSGAAYRAGFTLIELLAGIAIVGVLVAIIIPVAGSARESARVSRCAANMRGIWLGMELYSQGNRGFYPNATYSSAFSYGRDFVDRIARAGYMEDNPSAAVCPNDPAVRRDLALLSEGPRSYFLPVPGMAPGYSPVNRRHKSAIPNPSRVAMILEFYNSQPTAERARVRDRGEADFGVGWDIVSTDARAKDTSGHRDGRRNVVYADGHLAFMRPDAIRRENGSNSDFWGTNLVQ